MVLIDTNYEGVDTHKQAVIEAFLCDESAYCKCYYCAWDNVDKALAERIVGVPVSSKQTQSEVIH